jgi:hypothetical protein
MCRLESVLGNPVITNIHRMKTTLWLGFNHVREGDRTPWLAALLYGDGHMRHSKPHFLVPVYGRSCVILLLVIIKLYCYMLFCVQIKRKCLYSNVFQAQPRVTHGVDWSSFSQIATGWPRVDEQATTVSIRVAVCCFLSGFPLRSIIETKYTVAKTMTLQMEMIPH